MTPRVSTGKNHAACPVPERRPQGGGHATRSDNGDTPHALQWTRPVPHDRGRDSQQGRLMRAQRPVRAPGTGLGSVFISSGPGRRTARRLPIGDAAAPCRPSTR